MKSFFKYVLATVTGIVISAVVLFIITLGIIGAIVSSASSEKETVVNDNSILYVSFDHSISERTVENPFGSLDIPGYNIKNLGLDDIIARIKNAKSDSKIKGIYMNLSTVSTGFASLKEIRDVLLDFKTSGKFIVSYNENYTQKAYYLASVADKIYVNPEGAIDFKGLASSTMFMKDAFDKFGVDMQVVKVGTFKSAVEPFFLNEMSPANRLQVTSYLGSIYDTFIQEISTSRKITPDSLKNIASNYLVRNSDDAVKYKLADAKLYKDELIAELKKRVGVDAKDDLSVVSLLDYKSKANDTSGDANVAVLYAEGEIVGGEGETGEIGSEKISRELRKLREDDDVKAVVFRVNSPGGSALASDVIWREVELTKKVKPVIVSMGDYAASGGYYISAAADSIFAENNTITGSIGVFGVIPNFKNLLNNKIGVHFDGVKTGKFSDLGMVPDRPLTAEERDIIQMEVNHVYQTFMKRVSDGRKITIAQVDTIGQGRVWTGKQALEIGLVDRIGGIEDAIKSAAKKAKLDKYAIKQYPAKEDPFTSFLSSSKEKVQVWMAKEQMGEFYNYFNIIKNVSTQSGIQAKLPYTIEIH
ncbi:signal peptide peptidase SppA [Sphingobacterium sp. SRCM116780]|uniref:signal peptide peptidase SppA n=1 Tax=Sphingobacterium sp. SRCM116780 TaxID=2907623 RepID=UPI001F1F5081|nr:signal peptide peptidase SppA [Sphingobacterium sp. SRCM116780]UIR56638.1 signal peptide peptidase SppA [Sphingobacterium sp. SRCM116780]